MKTGIEAGNKWIKRGDFTKDFRKKNVELLGFDEENWRFEREKRWVDQQHWDLTIKNGI